MTQILHYIWQRRWRCMMIGVAIIAAASLLDPYIRQSIFGPRIRGVPWCRWEAEIRRQADPIHHRPNQFERAMAEWGILEESLELPPCDDAGLPLYLRLASDREISVRRLVIDRLYQWLPENQTDILPILRNRLADDDPKCRLIAAMGIWEVTEHLEAKPAVLSLLDQNDGSVYFDAILLLDRIARKDPDLFGPMSKLTGHSDPFVSRIAILSMVKFGPRALPFIRRRIRNREGDMEAAIASAGSFGKIAEELIPDLLALENDRDRRIRLYAAHALHEIAPKRFQKPPALKD